MPNLNAYPHITAFEPGCRIPVLINPDVGGGVWDITPAEMASMSAKGRGSQTSGLVASYVAQRKAAGTKGY